MKNIGFLGIFGYHANEVGALDMDEEEEDMTAVLEEEHGQGEDDENGEDARQKLRHFGYTKNFDPVAFHVKYNYNYYCLIFFVSDPIKIK